MAYRLTKEEKEIENNSDNLKRISKEKRNKVLSIIERARKGHAISLRLSEFDLEMIKKKAESEGLPYQTLINTVLHKYVTDQFYNKDEMRKIISSIKEIEGSLK
jgi:predicted DNA binding CopG/RHH family protein